MSTQLYARNRAIKAEIESIESRWSSEGRRSTDAERKRIDALSDELHGNMDQLSVGRINTAMGQSTGRVTEPDQPGGPDYQNRNRGGDDLAAEMRDRGYAEYRIPKRQDLDNLDDGGFRGMSDFLRAVKGTMFGRYDKRLEAWDGRNQKLSQSTSSGETGGYIIPPRHLGYLNMIGVAQAPFLDRLTMFQVLPGQQVDFARLADDDRSGETVATVKLGRTAENAEITEYAYELASGSMKLTKGAALIVAPNELVESSVPNQDALLADLFARLLVQTRCNDLVNGNGVAEPLGILNGLDKYSAATSSSANEIDIADVANMMARLEGANDPSVCWIAHRTVLAVLSAMTVGGTIPSNPVFLPSAPSGVPQTLMGADLFWTDACKTVNAVGDIILARMSAYLYLFAPPVIDVDTSVNFKKDQTTFRLKLRDAGQPLRGRTGRDLQNIETANFITLAVRS